MGRQTNTNERRLEIVLALMRVIARQGYTAASIQEIAGEAGLNPGLIHYHFESKQEILLTLFAHLEALVDARMASRVDLPPRNVIAGPEIDAMVDAFLALDTKSDQRAVMCWTMLSAEAIHNAELGKLFTQSIRKYQHRIEQILVRAAPTPRAAKAAIGKAAVAILAGIHGSFLLGCAAPTIIPKGSAAESVKRMARGLLENL